MLKMQFTKRIEAKLKDMRPGEADVARRLLREPSRIATHSLREIAAWCETSDATVLRAVRAAGFDGYQDLKFHVLRELTQSGVLDSQPLDVKSPTTKKTQGNCDLESSFPIEDVRASLRASQTNLPKAVLAIRRSKRIATVGLGASAGVGLVLADVLAAHGKPTLSLFDQETVEFILNRGVSDLVLVAVSHSGETGLPVQAVKRAKLFRIPSIGLTNEPSSQLGRSVKVLLPTQCIERPEGSFSMVPRLCQLAVLEQLVAALKDRLSNSTLS